LLTNSLQRWLSSNLNEKIKKASVGVGTQDAFWCTFLRMIRIAFVDSPSLQGVRGCGFRNFSTMTAQSVPSPGVSIKKHRKIRTQINGIAPAISLLYLLEIP
jgi:hypothetical protein